MGNRNINMAHFKALYDFSAQFVLTSLAAGAAWARVEAREHYPTDVLMGMALGNFTAVLIHDAFLLENNQKKVNIMVDGEGEISLMLEIKF
jgi:hypothetical protein